MPRRSALRTGYLDRLRSLPATEPRGCLSRRAGPPRDRRHPPDPRQRKTMKKPLLLALTLAAAVLAARLLAHDAPATVAAPEADTPNPRVLVYSDTAYYRHPDIPAINRWLVLLGH